MKRTAEGLLIRTCTSIVYSITDEKNSNGVINKFMVETVRQLKNRNKEEF